tara:strand:- start:1365 stop:1655 length:291 start_codon:yes stop_codon:yes gene_type:complete
MSEKIYINGIFIREKEFENGGSIMKVDIPNVSEFCDQLIQLANSEGKISLDIKTRMNKSENGLTHYCQLNTFVPKEQSHGNQNVNKGFQTGDDVPF